MAKIQLKSDNINPFGGLFSIFQQFDRSGLRQTIDSALGKRGTTKAAFSHGDVFASLFGSYLCGGDCIEDVMNIKPFWDGRDLRPDFGGRISAEIRLPQALQAGLLTPFQYLCISDDTDLSDDSLWSGQKYNIERLADKLCAQSWPPDHNSPSHLRVPCWLSHSSRPAGQRCSCPCVSPAGSRCIQAGQDTVWLDRSHPGYAGDSVPMDIVVSVVPYWRCLKLKNRGCGNTHKPL